MDCGGYCWGISRDHCRDPFPHALLSTRQFLSCCCGFGGFCSESLTALVKPGRKKYKLAFQNGSIKKKALKYGTPKPSCSESL